MDQQKAPIEQQDAVDTDIEIEFDLIGSLEDVTRGWTGPTDDWWDGDWTP